MHAEATTIASSKQKLIEVARTLSVTNYLAYRDYLSTIFFSVKNSLDSYSYWQFAEDLGFARSNLVWLITTGRRNLSNKTSDRIISALKLEGLEKKFFQTLVAYNNARRPDQRDELFATLLKMKQASLPTEEQQNHLEYYAEWYHPVIREMTGLKNFESNPQWIAERLEMRITPHQVQASLKLLEDLKLIQFDRRKKRHFPTGEVIRPDRNVGSMAAISHHQKMCELAADSLVKIEARRREFNTISLCISEEDAMEVSDLLYELCERIVKIEQKSKKKTQVYQINLQLFPLTKEKG